MKLLWWRREDTRGWICVTCSSRYHYAQVLGGVCPRCGGVIVRYRRF